jgi:hypothetical protein
MFVCDRTHPLLAIMLTMQLSLHLILAPMRAIFSRLYTWGIWILSMGLSYPWRLTVTSYGSQSWALSTSLLCTGTDACTTLPIWASTDSLSRCSSASWPAACAHTHKHTDKFTHSHTYTQTETHKNRKTILMHKQACCKWQHLPRRRYGQRPPFHKFHSTQHLWMLILLEWVRYCMGLSRAHVSYLIRGPQLRKAVVFIGKCFFAACAVFPVHFEHATCSLKHQQMIWFGKLASVSRAWSFP